MSQSSKFKISNHLRFIDSMVDLKTLLKQKVDVNPSLILNKKIMLILLSILSPIVDKRLSGQVF